MKFLLSCLMLTFCSFHVLAQSLSNSLSSFQTYDQNDYKAQVPLIINNNTQENIQKIESSISQEINNAQASMNKIPSTKNDPDYKNFLDKKNFLKNNKEEPSLWQGAALVVGFISLLGILAFIMTKFFRKGLLKKAKYDSAMNIISTLSINPKRQIMLIQIRDKEIVLSNTENGINFLTDIGISNNKETAIEKKQFQISNLVKSLQNAEVIKGSQTYEEENKNTMNGKKSDILIKALKRMEKEPQQEKSSKTEDNKQEANETSNKFPKYFSNLFENEAKKEVKKQEDADNVENVTNLIREKLRSMKPLN